MNAKRYSLQHEDTISTKFFILLYYIVGLIYDLVDHYVLPDFFSDRDSGLGSHGFGYWLYVYAYLLPLPFVYLWFRRPHSHRLKYLFFLVYTVTYLANDLATYWGTSLEYRSGNVLEFLIVLFSPIFVNKRFFYTVTFGTIVKYIVMGIILRSSSVILPIMLIVIFGFIAYVMLNRFSGYVRTAQIMKNKQLEGIVDSLLVVLGVEDAYTRGHSERVSRYSSMIAEKLGLFTEAQLDHLRNACLLHDIGKVNIPDEILNKPAALTPEEYEIIKRHTVVGSEMCRAIKGLEGYDDVIRSHHERWDGKGYPDALDGLRIPHLARIVAIADAFDAMTSSRSYRPALDPQEALSRVLAGTGTQFDPYLTAVFRDVYPSLVKEFFEDKPLVPISGTTLTEAR